MPRYSNQKAKLLYLQKILLEETDEEHPMTVAQMIKALEGYGIHAERKSIYSDIETLINFGLDIETVRDRSVGYYVADRFLQLPELKLLVDSVQASKFITKRKSEELIGKLTAMTGRHQAHLLRRQVFVSNRIKTENETVYYTVDSIHEAISNNSQITFLYADWTPKKEKKPRHGGKLYCVSPWALTLSDENYYLISFDHEHESVRHYRVDKMLNVAVTGEKRRGEELFRDFDTAIYTSRNFGMYSGEEERVYLRCRNHLAGVMIDRFGEDILFFNTTEETFDICVKAAISPLFLSWIVNFGDSVTVLSPDPVREKLLEHLRSVMAIYNNYKP